LNFLKKRNFGEYWFESGSPSFIVNYAKNAGLNDPEMFRNVTVLNNFTTAREIESAEPESLLFQAGYLTIKEKREQTLVLGYPNYEVEQALSQLFMEEIYRINTSLLVEATLEALDKCDLELLFKTYNRVLASMPYDDFPSRSTSGIKEPARKREGYYRSIFLTLLLSSGIRAESERHTSRGRADIVAYRGKRVYIFELKVADNPGENLLDDAMAQIEQKGYQKAFEDGRYEIVKVGLVIDDTKREVARWISSPDSADNV